jgi:hypothetical protein
METVLQLLFVLVIPAIGVFMSSTRTSSGDGV